MKEEGREWRWGKRKGVKGERECTQTTSINKTRGTGSISTFRHSREKKQRKQRSQGDRARTQKTKYMSVKKYRQQAPSPTACSLQVHTPGVCVHRVYTAEVQRYHMVNYHYHYIVIF